MTLVTPATIISSTPNGSTPSSTSSFCCYLLSHHYQLDTFIYTTIEV